MIFSPGSMAALRAASLFMTDASDLLKLCAVHSRGKRFGRFLLLIDKKGKKGVIGILFACTLFYMRYK
jgi:hypothetical protein